MDQRLATTFLKDVSRSFYLSLRFLPGGFREPASLGYLLARISDTIADAGDVEPELRAQFLEEFRQQVVTGQQRPPLWFEELRLLDGVSPGEQRLLTRVHDCLQVVDELPAWQAEAVRRVVGIIIEGQAWDLTRFEGDKVVTLTRNDELLRYTYQVAGCVGEFWTELGFGLGDFARQSRAQMDQWGRAYGQSLQLINILRDFQEDLALGRCYLPGQDRGPWFQRARDGLDQAEHYCQALNGKRLRFATWLPLLIGRETLDLLESHPETTTKVKICRCDVRRLMIVAVRRALA